ncbi:putative reverse transcriptase domain-containing protein [Tanacetum coccineum]
MAQRRATAPSIYHSLLPAGTPPLLPIPLPAPTTSRRADIPEADMPPQKRLLLTAPTPRVEVGESSAAARQPGSTMARRIDHSFVDTVDTREAQEDRAAVRAEIEILRRERLAYEQERQDADDRAIEHIIRTQALEAGARVDTLEDTGNASNKRKWESDHNGSSNQQHKGHKVFWAHAVGRNYKKYVGPLPLCNKCKCHHNGPCTVKYENWKKKYARTLPLCTKCNYHHKGQCAPKCNIYKKIGHLAQNCRTPAAVEYQRTLTCYECGGLGHYKRDCPELKNENHGNQAGSMEARGVVHAFGGRETKQDLNNIKDEIEA